MDPDRYLIVLPTYDERENLPRMVEALEAVRARMPFAGEVLVVDDNSPDGTGRLADDLAGRHDWLSVLHRPGKQGLGRAYLAGLNSSTLKPRSHVLLKDPVSGKPSLISDDSSASPTVGPDGDVYYGVLENPFPEHDARGWLLHFNANLTRAKTPGSFGWDNTVSVMPASAVPSYRGTSPYLLVSKYNNYLGLGKHGDGHNQVALLDPRASQKDPYAPARTMKAVKTILSPTSLVTRCGPVAQPSPSEGTTKPTAPTNASERAFNFIGEYCRVSWEDSSRVSSRRPRGRARGGPASRAGG